MASVYFVRHGETDANRDGRIPLDDSGLTESGIRAVEESAKLFSSRGIDQLYSGDTARALETAAIFDRILKPRYGVIVNDIFNERKLPSSILGTHLSDPVTVKKNASMEAFGLAGQGHESDEESYPEFFERVTDALGLLSRSSSANILVCTHAGFIKAATLLAKQGDVTLEDFLAIDREYRIRNAAIAHFMYESSWSIESEEFGDFLEPREG